MIASTITHPKFAALQRKLELPVFQCVGLLETIWLLAALHADDGDLSKFSTAEIASFVEWHGDADQLIDVLIELRWLDRDERGIQIHDWDQNCPSYIHDRRRKRSKRASASAQSNLTQECPGHSKIVSDTPDSSKVVQEIPGNTGKVSECRPREEQSISKKNNQSLILNGGLIASLRGIGITSPEDHIKSAIKLGKSTGDIRELIQYYESRQSQPNPPRAALLAVWLKGTKPWPAFSLPPKPKEEPYHKVKQPPTIGES